VEYVAPRSEVELELVRVWAEVLGVERVSIHDNFFELGGHSLLAMQLNSRVCQAFQIEIGINSIFDAPTVATLAELIARQTPAPTDDGFSLEDVLKEIEGLSADAVEAALSDEINAR
jgi:acyl carrier protein